MSSKRNQSTKKAELKTGYDNLVHKKAKMKIPSKLYLKVLITFNELKQDFFAFSPFWVGAAGANGAMD